MRLGVVGYSTRALVEAVVELGATAIAIDAFGDQDTLRLAEHTVVVESWPEGIVSAARPLAVDAWLLAGGMENQPEIVEQLRQLAPVLGPTAQQLLPLRDPAFWEAICQNIVGLAWPGAWERPPADHRQQLGFLYKQRSGSGGLHITRVAPEGGAGYWQPFIEGRTLGVTFIVGQQRVELLGVTESLSAKLWPGPTPFIYRGSVGPIGLSASQTAAVLSMAARVARALPDYRGWLQADYIEDRSGTLWLLELNPRWTAGMEVLHACGPLSDSPLTQHLGKYGLALGGSSWEEPTPVHRAGRSRWFLKAIVYAPRPLTLTQDSRRRMYRLRTWRKLSGSDVALSLADLPPLGPPAPILFSTGHPILTVRLRLS